VVMFTVKITASPPGIEFVLKVLGKVIPILLIGYSIIKLSNF